MSLPTLLGDVPVDPDAPEARRWLLDELAKDKYSQTTAPSEQPSWLTDWLRAINDWLKSLFSGGGVGQGTASMWSVVLILVVIAVLVVAFLLFGVPRLNRRRRRSGELFGDEDGRDPDSLRRSARSSADQGDYATAITEQFRALARTLSERTLVTTSPGTTARGFARQAGTVFPDAAARLMSGADAFDGVRYLEGHGTAEQWSALVALDRELSKAPSRSESQPESRPDAVVRS